MNFVQIKATINNKKKERDQYECRKKYAEKIRTKLNKLFIYKYAITSAHIAKCSVNENK